MKQTSKYICFISSYLVDVSVSLVVARPQLQEDDVGQIGGEAGQPYFHGGKHSPVERENVQF